MVQATNTIGLAPPMATESTFSIVFRGYSKREVDQYTRLNEADLAAAQTERLELQARIKTLSDQLREANAELVELRRRPQLDSRVTFRHLGLRVEQILAEAEEQAEAVRKTAIESVQQQKDLAEAELRDAEGMRARITREVEADLSLQRAEAEREVARTREALTMETDDARAYARRIRTEADAILSEANEEARRVLAAAKANCERMWADCAAGLESVHRNAENQAKAITASAETYARQTREAAELDATQTRAQSDEYAARTRAAVEEHLARIRDSAGHAFTGPVVGHIDPQRETDDHIPVDDSGPGEGNDGTGSRHRAKVSSRASGAGSDAMPSVAETE
jgi:cell division septum initiation protein DivIVA